MSMHIAPYYLRALLLILILLRPAVLRALGRHHDIAWPLRLHRLVPRLPLLASSPPAPAFAMFLNHTDTPIITRNILLICVGVS